MRSWPSTSLEKRTLWDAASDLGGATNQMEIVGLVKNGKTSDPKEKQRQFVYGSYSQRKMDQLTFYARTVQDPLSMAQALRDEVRRQDANMPIFNVKTLERQIDESLFMDRLVAMLSAASVRWRRCWRRLDCMA